jgi:hypothetical protein
MRRNAITASIDTIVSFTLQSCLLLQQLITLLLSNLYSHVLLRNASAIHSAVDVLQQALEL